MRGGGGGLVLLLLRTGRALLDGGLRVLNDLKKARLSRRSMTWLLPPSPPVSKLSLFLSSCVSPVALTGGRGGGEGGEPNHTRARKTDPL